MDDFYHRADRAFLLLVEGPQQLIGGGFEKADQGGRSHHRHAGIAEGLRRMRRPGGDRKAMSRADRDGLHGSGSSCLLRPISRSSVLRILPLAVCGNAVTLKNCAGILNLAMRPAQKAASEAASASPFNCTAAATVSP